MTLKESTCNKLTYSSKFPWSSIFVIFLDFHDLLSFHDAKLVLKAAARKVLCVISTKIFITIWVIIFEGTNFCDINGSKILTP